MRIWCAWTLILLGVAAGRAADPVPEASAPTAMEAAIADVLSRPAAQRAFWGAQAVWLDTGEPVYELNAEKLFTPASTAKLYSTALALDRLGPDYRYVTEVVSESPVGPEGVISGDVLLIGGGDPNLSARVLPYDSRLEYGNDLLAPITELAEQVVASGVRRIEGSVVGDDSRYMWSPYPPGWSIEDATFGYGAPVSALSFHDNFVEILVRPGAAGGPARLKIDPPVDYFRIANRTVTRATRTVPRRLNADRGAAPRDLVLWGDISARSAGREMTVAVEDPALYAALALETELERLGVTITGEARSQHLDAYNVPDPRAGGPPVEKIWGARLARRESRPLAETLPVVNKESVNLHAEMLLREAGYAQRGVGSVEAGIEEMRTFLRDAGLSPWEFFLDDGSGLSRKDLVSPAGTVKLLRAMHASDNGAVYRRSLAVAGVDGTLDWRFSRTAAKERVQAKTGTLSHVTALAGYATDVNGREMAFAIFVNNFGVSTSYVRNLVDRMVLVWTGAE